LRPGHSTGSGGAELRPSMVLGGAALGCLVTLLHRDSLMLDTLDTHGFPGRPAKITGTLIDLVNLEELESINRLEADDETCPTASLQSSVVAAARGLTSAWVLTTETRDNRLRCFAARGWLTPDHLQPSMLNSLLEAGEVVLRSSATGLVDVTVYRRGIDRWVDGELVGLTAVDATSERGVQG